MFDLVISSLRYAVFFYLCIRHVTVYSESLEITFCNGIVINYPSMFELMQDLKG